MVNPFHTGGIGKNNLNILGRFRVVVTGGGSTKGVVTVRVHPDDLPEAERTFRRSLLDNALSSTGTALMFSSVFSSAFNAICITGLLAGRGFEGSKKELIERAFPQTPHRLLQLATEVHTRVLALKVSNPKLGGSGGSGGGSGDDDDGGSGSGSGADGSSGSGGGSDSDAFLESLGDWWW